LRFKASPGQIVQELLSQKKLITKRAGGVAIAGVLAQGARVSTNQVRLLASNTKEKVVVKSRKRPTIIITTLEGQGTSTLCPVLGKDANKSTEIL
jgi:hypothetical protein